MDVWLNAQEVTQLEKASIRTIQWRIKEGKYPSEKVRQVESSRGGRGGKEWQIHLSALTPPAQAIYLQRLADRYRDEQRIEWTSIPEEKVLALHRWNLAKDDDRDDAHVKSVIVKAWTDGIRNAQGKTVRTAQFIELYNEGRLPGIEAEVYQAVPQISLATLYRWKAEYQRKGLAGLLRKADKPNQLKLSQEQQDFIVAHIKESPGVIPARVRDYMEMKWGKDATPHVTTVFRFMKRWKDENEQLYCYLCNPADWKNRYQIAIGRKDASVVRFCQVWEIDSTPADLICSDGKRYTCLAAVDVFSRKALVVLSETSKATAIAALIRKGIVEWGVPEVIIRDNGKDYVSRHVDAICASLDIVTPEIPKFTPEAKPHVERFNRTLMHWLVQELPGYCGHNVAQRQALRAREQEIKECAKSDGENVPVTVALGREELTATIDKWIKYIYEQSVHSGIDALPAEMPARSEAPVRRIEDERVLDILLAPVRVGTVQKKGIALENTWFQSPDQGPYIGRKVELRRDMGDAGKIYVFGLHGDLAGRYLYTAFAEELAGWNTEEILEAKKAQKKHLKEGKKALQKVKDLASKTPMLDLVRKAEEEGDNIVPLVQSGTFESSGLQEAIRTLEDQEKINQSLSEEEFEAKVAAVVNFSDYSRPKVDEAEYHRKVAALESAVKASGGGVEDRPISWASPIKHYEWCLDQMAKGIALPDGDRKFMVTHEEGMDADTREYWTIVKEMKGIA